MTRRDTWLTTHPYLRRVGDFQTQFERVAASIPVTAINLPNWDDYSEEFNAGVPLLQSTSYAFDFETAGRIFASLTMALASIPLPDKLAFEIRELSNELSQNSDGPIRAIEWLLDKQAAVLPGLGIRRYIGWAAVRRYLRPLVEGFTRWRQEENWLRRYCPTCGSHPAMAQLIGVDPGRLRFLFCGGCETRWRFRRTGCPFCEIEDDHCLTSITFEGEGGLRIDYCASCGSYIKTYDGIGNESVLLADWTSLHLDVFARERGLVPSAESLYELS